tara:strand:- start:18 stop:299 length:282 start_codon:yes stop_codon:yes gene_type:complete
VAAVALIISLSCSTIGLDNSSIVSLADIALVLNKLKTFADASVNVNVIESAFPESSDTIIDFIIPVVDAGTVYTVVTEFVVKSFFAFVNTLAT